MQSTNSILLIRPSNFIFNTETAANNAFQNNIEGETQIAIHAKVLQEFNRLEEVLIAKGIQVTTINDSPTPIKPDAIFPNNWISFHTDGTVILYPMFAANRRLERRLDIIELLKSTFTITKVIDLSTFEKQGIFLEGTGSMIFDHENKIAYACLSPRTDKGLFMKCSNMIGYKPIYFTACDEQGKEIYHTNVMMCVAQKFAVICLDAILDITEKKLVKDSLTNTGHCIIDINFAQMNSFAGNMLELKGTGKPIIAMSLTACNSLTKLQKVTIEEYAELLPIAIPTIETIGGGSVRCMIAEIFLPLHMAD